MSKLLKLEVNDSALVTDTAAMKNLNDASYINARNGEAVFDITGLSITKLNFVFWNCNIAPPGVRLSLYAE